MAIKRNVMTVQQMKEYLAEYWGPTSAIGLHILGLSEREFAQEEPVFYANSVEGKKGKGKRSKA